MLDFGFYNMDCLKGMQEFPDRFFDLAIVDPVYGDVTQGGYMFNNKKGTRWGNKKVAQKGYHAGLWHQEKTGADYFTELMRVSKNQIIWGGNYFADMLPTSQCWVVWDKMHTADLRYADGELAWTSFDKATRIFHFLWNGFLQGNQEKERRIHPTQKPVDLYKWLLQKFASPGDKILDTHAGSASSLVACQDLGFDYVGFEIDPVYYQDARERLEDAKKQMRIEDLLTGGRQCDFFGDFSGTEGKE